MTALDLLSVVAAIVLIAVAARWAGGASWRQRGDEGKVRRGRTKRVLVLYGSAAGNAARMASSLEEELRELPEWETRGRSASEVDPEELLPVEASRGSLLLLLVSTQEEGSAPGPARWLDRWLQESAADFRVQHSLLAGLRFAVFGLGDSAYGEENFNAAGRRIDRNLRALGAERIHPLGLGDDSGRREEDFWAWKGAILRRLTDVGGESDLAGSEEESEEESAESEQGGDGDDLMDVEDIGTAVAKSRTEDQNGVRLTKVAPREMLTPLLRKSLTKQGYHLVGSHSGVKICRWTKAMLRGRGGCYKHTFYGIESHRCMEVTTL